MLRGWILAFAAGAAWLQTRPVLPDPAWAALLPLAAIGLSLVPARGKGFRAVRSVAIGLLALAAGFLYAAWRAELRLADALPPDWEGRDVILTGRVVGLPEPTPRGQRFVLDVAAVDTPGARVPARLRLGSYGVGNPLAGDVPPSRVAGGDCLTLTVRLHRPQGSLNPGGFDYTAWLLERNIRAEGSVRGQPVAAGACPGQASAWLDRTREALRRHLLESLGERPHRGIVTGLAVGDQDAIPAASWTLFRQTGTSHLFSVSGLHITLFSALVYGLVRLVWRRFPRLCLIWPAQRAGILLGFPAAFAYALLSGFAIPAQRTVLMLAGAAFVVLLDRGAAPTRLLAAALAAVVLADPWAALAPGFWLSFMAVAALLWVSRPGEAAWKTWLRAQWAVTLVLTPILLALFHEVSLVSPLANALAIPLVSLVAVPLSLLAALLPWAWPAQLAHGVVAGVMTFLGWLAALPQPVWHGASPGPPALVLALAGAGLLLAPRGGPARWLGILLFLPLFFPRQPAPAPGEAWFTVLDVGQGNAVLVRTAHRALLVDAGPRYASGEDAGARVIAPALWHQGINRLDGLVVSHDDGDHSGGAASLLASHQPPWLLTSLAGLPRDGLSPEGSALLAAGIPAMACVAGQAWRWDGVTFRVLHPAARQYRHPGFSDNDRSCVLRVETPWGSVLMPGDAERLAEMDMGERRMPLMADVLVAPHHGSKSSSTPDFLAAVAPGLVLVSVGRRNAFGHPHPAVLARYREAGARVERTDRDGALTVRLTAEGLRLERQREVSARYWRE